MFLLLILLIFAIVSSFFGCLILWQKITNYFDSFAHSAIFAASIASILHIDQTWSLIIFAILFSSLLFICIFFNLKLNNTLLIIISSAFIAGAITINNFHAHHQLNHTTENNTYLENQQNTPTSNESQHIGCAHADDDSNFFEFLIGMPLQKWPLKEILNTIFILAGIFIVSLFCTRQWIIGIINKDLYAPNFKDYLFKLIFLIILGIFSVIMVKFNGVLFSVSLSIFPALIARYFQKGPYKTIFIAIFLNIILTSIAFNIARINPSLNFNIILLSLQFLSFISAASSKKIYKLMLH